MDLTTITLDEQTNYRLMEISDIKDYFSQEMQYQQSLTSKLSKYLPALEYADKILSGFFDSLLWDKYLMLKLMNNYLV